MKTIFRFSAVSFCVFLLVVSGCGKTGNIVPVSGTLTLDGEPMPGVEIVLSPKAIKGNSNVGPYSFATTDQAGKFQMKTRYGDIGAVIGSHSLTMQYSDIEPDTMAILRDELSQAKASGEGVEEVKAEIEAVTKKLKGRKPIPKSAGGTFDVPEGGNENVAFKLTTGE